MSGCDEEMAAAAGRVHYLQLQNRGFGIRRSHGFVKDRFQRGIEQAIDQTGRRVVASGCLPLVAGGGRQAKDGASRFNSGRSSNSDS